MSRGRRRQRQADRAKETPPSPGSGAFSVRARFRAFLLLGAGAVWLLVLATMVRNLVWWDEGSLWLDIAEKTHAHRILDPATGREAPRSERARIYNNIGLYLYDRGREVAAARRRLAEARLALRAAVGPGEASGADPLPAADAGARLEAVAARRQSLLTLQRRLVSRTPSEFLAALHRRGVRADRTDWDPYRPAEMAFRKALYHAPDYYIARLNLGLVHKLRGELDRAEEQFRLAHLFSPTYIKALRYHAEVLAATGETEEATALLERAAGIARDPGTRQELRAYPETLLALGRLYLKAERYGEAREVFRRYLDQPFHDPRLRDPHEGLAAAHLGLDRAEDAAAALARGATVVEAAWREEGAADPAGYAVPLLRRRVEVLLAGGEGPEAVRAGEELAAARTDDPEAWRVLALALWTQGDPDAALAAIDRAVDLAPHEAAYRDLRRSFVREGFPSSD